ncbi:hypothetical protein OSB04_004337 [Centaurea solstitialis]|uniref:DUF1421 domain-containing protein n=1 Tax=Centaurea solstitialis TaxID=347529 RepID=A0AA38WVX1_9ASTR|nr:hypothetical protein OSB04_004337 [Centaurea solstitialis]
MMEHYKSRNNDFFHFTNPHDHDDDLSDLDDDDDYHQQLQSSYDVDDDDARSYGDDFTFHTFTPFPKTNCLMNQKNDTVEELRNGALVFHLDNLMKNLSDSLYHRIGGIDTQISRLEDGTCKLDKYVEDVKDSTERHHGTTPGSCDRCRVFYKRFPILTYGFLLLVITDLILSYFASVVVEIVKGMGRSTSVEHIGKLKSEVYFAILNASWEFLEIVASWHKLNSAIKNLITNKMAVNFDVSGTFIKGPVIELLIFSFRLFLHERIFCQVQDGVLFLRDKHEIAETRLQLAKLKGSKRDKTNVAQTNPKQPLPTPASQSPRHIPYTDLNQQSSNTVTFPEAVPFHPAVSQAPEITVQQSQMPHQNKADPQFPHFTQSYQLNPFQGVVIPQNHPYLSHPSQETPNRPSDSSYSPSVRHFPFEPAKWGSAHEHEGRLPHYRNYEPEFHANYNPEFASFSNIHPHRETPFSHEIPNAKPVEFSMHPQEESRRSNYKHTPVAQALPHALPTASDVEDGSSSEENVNSIPVEEIVNKVTAMGFRRDLVRANVRKLTENGSSVDLNAVLDRMMNNK